MLVTRRDVRGFQQSLGAAFHAAIAAHCLALLAADDGMPTGARQIGHVSRVVVTVCS